MKAIKFLIALLFTTIVGTAFAGMIDVHPVITIVPMMALSFLPVPGGILSMAATINLTELISEFGTWLGDNVDKIKTILLAKTETMNYMTSVIQAGDYRASKATIDDLVQGFQKGWTAKGTPAFTPITIPQRRHKVDLEFYPDEIVGTWLGFLAEENRTREEWPITRYIIEQLVLPKIAQNRELKLIGVGNYASPAEGSAQATGLSMDGFCTILEDKKAAGTSAMNFYTAMDPTTSNIVDFVDAFVSWMDEAYQNIEMPIFCSRAWYKAYKLKYRELYGANEGYAQKEAGSQIDFTLNRLVPLPSMAGKNIFLATPKENFIRLLNINDGPSFINVETAQRELFVFADWHESVGFGVEEAVFAYVPEASGSASA